MFVSNIGAVAIFCGLQKREETCTSLRSNGNKISTIMYFFFIIWDLVCLYIIAYLNSLLNEARLFPDTYSFTRGTIQRNIPNIELGASMSALKNMRAFFHRRAISSGHETEKNVLIPETNIMWETSSAEFKCDLYYYRQCIRYYLTYHSIYY